MTQGKRLFSLGKICAWSKKTHVLWMGLSTELLETSNNDSSEHETLKELQFCSYPSGVASCSFAPQLLAIGFVVFVFVFLLLPVLGLHCYLGFFSSWSRQGALSGCRAWTSHCGGLSGCWPWALECWTSAVVAPPWCPTLRSGSPPQTRGQTHISCSGRWSLPLGPQGEAQKLLILKSLT